MSLIHCRGSRIFRTDNQGGTDVWGNISWAPDDEPDSSHTHGELIAFRRAAAVSAQDLTHGVEQTKNMTADDASTWILERTPSTFQVYASRLFFHDALLTKEQKMIWTNYSFGIERDEEVLKKNALDPRKWTNPLEVQCVTLNRSLEAN